MRVYKISFWLDNSGIIGIKPTYNHMEGQLIGSMTNDAEPEDENEVYQRDWAIGKQDDIYSIMVLHSDTQLLCMEIITTQRERFYCGGYTHEDAWESRIDTKKGKSEIRQIIAYMKDDKIRGLEIEMI